MSLNWRKPLVFFLLWAKRSPIIEELKFVQSIEYKSPEEIREIQERRLVMLLRYAWENTEYYKKVLSECNVVCGDKVNIDRFEDIPFLTKEIILTHGPKLKSKILPKGRKPYVNRTGGSTGEPVEYWQDSYYDAVNTADKLYHFYTFGKDIGDVEMKIWGSDRDIFTDTGNWKVKLKNFLYNRKIQTCRNLSEETIRSIVKNMNRVKPKIIWGYVDGVYTIAKYINQHKMELHSPAAIFCGGGTLFPHIEEVIYKAFHAPAINFYGSREMGDVACECSEKAGLHVTSHSHKLEIIDLNGKPLLEEDGDIVITSLTNYAMPFIRYKIGDRGRMTTQKCSCGRGFPLIKSVSGRSMESFITVKGEFVSPIYLITMIGTSFNPGYVKKFQIVQDTYTQVTVKMVLNNDIKPEDVQMNLDKISEKIRTIMGPECVVSFEFVDVIPHTNSGKYLYTVRKFPMVDKPDQETHPHANCSHG